MSGDTILTPYLVTYSVVDDARTHQAPCLLEEGETTVADFPKMIATRIFGDPTRHADVTVIEYRETL